ncbi:MAG: hypothetical protein ACK4Y7_04900 [Caldimicrobium sp.]
MERIQSLIEDIERRKKLYSQFIKKGDKIRKRERDTFLTEKDRVILIESVVAGVFIENLLAGAVKKVLKFL